MKQTIILFIGVCLVTLVTSVLIIGEIRDLKDTRKAQVEAYCEGWKAGQSSHGRCENEVTAFKQDSTIYTKVLDLYENK